MVLFWHFQNKKQIISPYIESSRRNFCGFVLFINFLFCLYTAHQTGESGSGLRRNLNQTVSVTGRMLHALSAILFWRAHVVHMFMHVLTQYYICSHIHFTPIISRCSIIFFNWAPINGNENSWRWRAVYILNVNYALKMRGFWFVFSKNEYW